MKYLDLTGLQKLWTKIKTHVQTSLEGYAKKTDLSTVATSGSYNDLTDKPEGGSAEIGDTIEVKEITLSDTSNNDDGSIKIEDDRVSIRGANSIHLMGGHGGDILLYEPDETIHIDGGRAVEIKSYYGGDNTKIYVEDDGQDTGLVEIRGRKNVSIRSDGCLHIGIGDSYGSAINFYDDGSGIDIFTNTLALGNVSQIVASISKDSNYKSSGEPGQVLTSNGDGDLYWGNVSGGTSSGDSSIIDLGITSSHKEAQQAMIDHLTDAETGCYLFKYYCDCYGNACFAVVKCWADDDIVYFEGTVYDNYRGFRQFQYNTVEGFILDGCWVTLASFDEDIESLPTETKNVIDAIRETHSIALNGYKPSNLTFTSLDDGNTWIVYRDYEDTRQEALIPLTYEGSPVVAIGNEAFKSRYNLDKVIIPNSITSIGEHAFYCCSSLDKIIIPNSVTSIGKFAFGDCSSLNRLVIPNSVTSIGTYAFYNCDNLTIYCEAHSKPDGWDARWNPSNCPVVWGTSLDIISLNDKLKALESRIAALEGN